MVGTKWKIWILSFHGYVQKCSCSGLVTALGKNQVFLVLFQNWPNLPVLTTCFLLSFFQNAVIWSTIKIITWNQLQMLTIFLNFYEKYSFLPITRPVQIVDPMGFHLKIKLATRPNCRPDGNFALNKIRDSVKMDLLSGFKDCFCSKDCIVLSSFKHNLSKKLA